MNITRLEYWKTHKQFNLINTQSFFNIQIQWRLLTIQKECLISIFLSLFIILSMLESIALKYANQLPIFRTNNLSLLKISQRKAGTLYMIFELEKHNYLGIALISRFHLSKPGLFSCKYCLAINNSLQYLLL